jgi:hypothetical protein
MGGVVNHSSNLPDPVALSSTEAEYNEGCTTMMAAEGIVESSRPPTTIYFDSRNAMAMGNSCKDTKHTRHIMLRYHYIRENIAANRFDMRWIPTQFQIADIGTKLTPGPRYQFLVDCHSMIDRELMLWQ